MHTQVYPPCLILSVGRKLRVCVVFIIFREARSGVNYFSVQCTVFWFDATVHGTRSCSFVVHVKNTMCSLVRVSRKQLIDETPPVTNLSRNLLPLPPRCAGNAWSSTPSCEDTSGSKHILRIVLAWSIFRAATSSILLFPGEPSE